MTLVKIRAKREFGGHEIIRVAGGGGISHLGHLFDVAHTGRDDGSGDGDIQNEIALEELDLANGPSLEELFSSIGPTGMLELDAGALRRVHRVIREGGDRRDVVLGGGDLGHLGGIEVGLRASVAALIGFCIPARLVVVVVGVLCVVAGLRREVVCSGGIKPCGGHVSRATHFRRDRCGGKPWGRERSGGERLEREKERADNEGAVRAGLQLSWLINDGAMCPAVRCSRCRPGPRRKIRWHCGGRREESRQAWIRGELGGQWADYWLGNKRLIDQLQTPQRQQCPCLPPAPDL